MTESDLLRMVAERGIQYRERLSRERVTPSATADALRAALGGPAPERSSDATAVVNRMADVVEAGGLMGMDSGRFFGFVVGGALPAAVAADWLVTAWDQNTGLFAPSPATAVIEEIAGRWILELLGLPPESSFGFVTGGQMSNTTALEASSVGLEVGSRTTVDVLNAQQQLYAAQRDYSRSRYDYLVAVLNLKAATGQLEQKDLNDLDALLGFSPK